jgi:hypothetical protein
MGQLYHFSCPECGYRAEVSGGGDAGMMVLTTTIVCTDCRCLYDIVTAETEDQKPPKQHELRCPEFPTHKVIRWKNGDPCPKCGTQMVKGKMGCLWD